MARYCPNCGTEVDDSAVFCPTCGQPIDQAAETEIPAAPAWPEPTPVAAPPPVDDAGWSRPEESTRVEEAVPPAPASAAHVPMPDVPPPPPPPAPTAPGPPEAAGPARAPVNLPVTMPVTLSAWLIGGGSALAAVGVLIGLFGGFPNPIDLLLLVVLIGIAATVFLAANVPAIPHLRLATFSVTLVAFGYALDRIAIGAAGAGELLLFLGVAAAGIGALILELGRDQPLGGPSS